MRVCVIFNPAARGNRASRFRESLAQLASSATFLPTSGPGAARALARQAVLDGYSHVFAAGGDGTVFEVLNGLADVVDGFERVSLGVIPLGTANVLAHEIGMPLDPPDAWRALAAGRSRPIDVGVAEYVDANGQPAVARFCVVAGAGLDARAVQLVSLRWKRRIGKLAYVVAALRAWWSHPDWVRTRIGGRVFEGRVVLAGNGRNYAGAIPIFEDGDLGSGFLHVRGVPRVDARLLIGCARAYLTSRWPFAGRFPSEATPTLRLECRHPVPLELDGEFVGWLPASLRIEPGRLSILVPD